MGRGQGRPQIGVAQQRRLAGGQAHAQPDDGAGNRPAPDGARHKSRGVGLVFRDSDIHRHKGPGGDFLKTKIGQPPALRRTGVKVNQTEALFVVLLGKVHPLQAAGIGHCRPDAVGSNAGADAVCRRRAQNLMLVDMPQGDILQPGLADGGEVQRVVVAQHHGSFGAYGGAADGDMAGQDGRRVRVQGLGQARYAIRHTAFDFLADLLNVQAPGFVAGQHRAPGRPRHGQYLQRAGGRGYGVIGHPVAHIDLRHAQGGVDFNGVGAAGGCRQVVIAGQQEGGDAGVGKPAQPAGQFPLVGLRRVAALVGVPGQENQIHPVGQGELHQLVQRPQEIAQSGGQPGVGVGAAVVLYADVQVGKMQDSHNGLPRPKLT